MNFGIIVAIIVLVIILYFSAKTFKKTKNKPLTAEQVAQAALEASVLAQISVLEAQLANTPTAILQKQINDLKASIGQL